LTDECGSCVAGKRLFNGLCQWSYFDSIYSKLSFLLHHSTGNWTKGINWCHLYSISYIIFLLRILYLCNLTLKQDE
jgi:hypothetical protein